MFIFITSYGNLRVFNLETTIKCYDLILFIEKAELGTAKNRKMLKEKGLMFLDEIINDLF